MRHWILLLFLTLGMNNMYYPMQLTVAAVDHGVVTMESVSGETYTIAEAEAWRVGDRAECIMSTSGTQDKADDTIIEARYIWRRER